MWQLKKKTLAVAVGMAIMTPAAFAGTAIATANINSVQSSAGMINTGNGTRNTASVRNHVLQNAKGNVGVNVAAGAGNMQANNGNIATTAGSLTKNTSAMASITSAQVANALSSNSVKNETNSTNVHDHVLQNASGNVGLNAAAGSDNMQANNMALSQGQGVLPGGAADTSIVSAQISGPVNSAVSSNNDDTAALRNHVLQNASGNIGVNVAAGEQNMGVNNLAVAYNRGNVNASAAIASVQAADLVAAMTSFADNDASLQNHVLQHASGNVGVNVASGAQNMQGNSLALSTENAALPLPTGSDNTSSANVTSVQVGGFVSGAMNRSTDNDAFLNDHVLQYASGNVGVNVAAGVQNMQVNNSAVALVFATMNHGGAATAITNNQGSGPVGISLTKYGDNDASLSNHVLQHASGNIGVNVASGTENMQANNLGYAYKNAGTIATTSIDNDQGTEGFLGNRARLSGTAYSSDKATIQNHVMQNVSGNIGANVAAGDFNGQANNLAISSAGGASSTATTSSANIHDNQISNLALSYTEHKGDIKTLPSVAVEWAGDMGASLKNHVLQNASGNVGVNVAAGLQNLQANNTALSIADGANLGGSTTASVMGSQVSGPWSFAKIKGGESRSATNTASVRDHVLQNASGKIGANVAAGVQNMQSNDLAYAFNQGGGSAGAYTKVSQASLGAITTGVPLQRDEGSCCAVPVSNTATVSDHVMQNATGDIGLNVASGAANLQRNTLSISAGD